MAVVPITIVGTQTSGETTTQVTITGLASITGLEVGGGPAQPPNTIWPGPGIPAHPIAPGGPPNYPSQGPGFPTQPIYLPPYVPGGPPVTIWPNPGHPAHPIVIPPPPEQPPEGGNKPPPAEGGGWGYIEPWGWAYFPAGGKPVPPG